MHARIEKSRTRTVFLALAGLVTLVTACSSSDDSAARTCSCPAGVFLIDVPADRAGDIAAVTASGSCSNASAVDQKTYSVEEDDVGVCHIRVQFQSTNAEFDTDVTLQSGPSDCEKACAPTPASAVIIPEVDEDAAGASGQ